MGVELASICACIRQFTLLGNQQTNSNQILSEAFLGWRKGCNWIRTVVSMATDSSHRVIMGKLVLPLFLGCFSSDLFSSSELLGSYSELIVYPSSLRPSFGIRPPFSKIFFSETAWPIKAKFYVEPPWEGGTKVCINCSGHMAKMATMPIYGNNL